MSGHAAGHPTDNHFLARLPRQTRARLDPDLRRVTLAVGQRLIEPMARVPAVHFPIDCQLANLAPLGSGHEIETSVIGCEGLSGLAPALADEPCQWGVAVRAGGDAWVLPAEVLRRQMGEDSILRSRLMVLTGFYQAQASQSAACNIRHEARARLARWLLTAADLSPGVPLRFTQEGLAGLLGYSRTTVVEIARPLKVAKVLRYDRGVIRIQDRAALEAEACECYRILRRVAETQDILPRPAPS